MESKKRTLVAVATVIVVGIILIVTGVNALGGNEHGQVAVSPHAIDYGDIVQKDGSVSRTVTVANVGKGILELHRLSTSCGCTTAEMDMSDMEPDESREMKITFDPLTHPDQLGPIIRVVYLQTSDPDRSEVEIDVTGNVLASED